MMRTLILKELREGWWIAAAITLLLFVVILEQMGMEFGIGWPPLRWRQTRDPAWSPPVPFVSDSVMVSVLLFAGVGAAVLGLRQTLGESVQGTWVFLLHRPVSRTHVLVAKLLAGVLLITLGMAIPLLVYVLWAMTPGTHASPFFVWMLQPTLLAAFAVELCYLAAFLCGLRPARWWASRWWPAVPLAVVIFLVVNLPWLAPSVVLCVLLAALLIPSLLFVNQHRDFA